ncbi:MAG: endolytic transglycosylase MltG [Chloroflexi bacterium]|nr:endolytic transglycosylase MltG [Chloroflexota bacterium]
MAVLFTAGGQLQDKLQSFILGAQLSGRASELDAPFGTDAKPMRFHIPAGAGAGAIAAALGEARLIRDTSLFVDFARLEGYDRRFEAGVYFLNQTQSIRQIALLLTDSSKSFIPFRSVEGARIEELAELVDLNGLFGFTSAEFLLLVDEGAFIAADLAAWANIPPGASLEGFMFPDTYQLPPDITAEGLRDVLLRTFRDRVGDSLRDEATAQGLTLYEAVTLASIIERESVWRDEQPMIASVYRNRLLIGMKLEADPTVQYGIQGTRESWWPQITRADYREVQSPYNTYLIGGLPPGPIASPGLSAIQAAIYPAESGYYFFRAACDNSHYHNFAVTFEEHVANAC